MAWTERYVRSDAAGGGDGTTDTNSGANGAFTLAEAITNSTSNTGFRYNVRAGTYANTTTSRTFSGAGTVTAQNWWRGFNTTIGDIDTNNTLTKPEITFTTGVMTVSGAHQLFSALSISGQATSGAQLQFTNTTTIGICFDRCRIVNTGTNAASSAVGFNNSTSGNLFTRCYFSASSSATNVIGQGVASGYSVTLLGCVIRGGGSGVGTTGGGIAINAHGCVFYDNGSSGVSIGFASTVVNTITGCTFYSPAVDGVRISAAPGAQIIIVNCIFSDCGGYGINNSTGTNTTFVKRAGNLFYNNTSGKENGLGDSPSMSEQTDSSSPFTNAAGADLSLVSTSNAKANGIPGTLENESYTSYADIGAVQRQEAGGSGGGPLIGPGRLIR